MAIRCRVPSIWVIVDPRRGEGYPVGIFWEVASMKFIYTSFFAIRPKDSTKEARCASWLVESRQAKWPGLGEIAEK